MRPASSESAAFPARAPAGVIRNMSWLAAGNLAVKPLWFVFTTAVCIRILGPTEYGLFVAALALAMIVAAFSDWGLSDYAVGEAARKREGTSDLFSNLTVLRSALAALAIVATLVVGIAMGRRGHNLSVLMAAAAYTGAFRLLEYVRSYFRSSQVLRYEAISVMAERALTVVCGTLGLVVRPDAVGVLLGMSAGASLALVANLAWMHRHMHRFARALVSWPASRTALRSAFPLGVYGFLSILFLNVGTVLLERLAGPDAAGQYGAAYRFVEVAALLPAVVVAAIYPKLSALYAAHSADFWRVLVRSAALAGAVATAAAAVLAVLGPRLLTLLTGTESFDGAGLVLAVVVWQIPLMTLSGVLGAGLMASQQARTLATALVVVVPVNVALNVVLVPTYSFIGTAAALLVGQALAVVLFSWRLARLHLSYSPHEPNSP